MTNDLKTALENGATRQLTISFPDDQALPDLTEEITEGSASFSRVLSSEDDLTFGATPAQFKFDANGIPDVAGKRIKATWNISYEDEQEASVWSVPIFNGFVETAGIQPDRETREIVAYDVLKQARDLDVSARLRALFSPTVKAEYKGTYDPTASYSYGDVVLADGVHYRWLVKATDMIMVNDEPELVSDVLEGLTMTQIVSAYGQYVQAITDYDEYQYETTTLQNVVNAVAIALVRWSVENINHAANRGAVIHHNKEIEKMKAGEVLNAFCMLAGGFVYVNPSNGRLRYVWLGSETVDFSNNYEAMNSTYSEYATPAIGKVEIVNDAGVIIGTYGSGTSVLQVRNPLTYGMTPANAATYAQALHGRVSTYGYVSANLSSIVSFPLTPGTKLTVSTPTGESFQTFALEDSMSGVQMINQTVVAKGKATRTTENYEPLQDYLNRKNAEEAARALEEAKRAEAQAWTNEVKAARALEQKAGLYTTKVASPTGGFVYYMHDKETLAESEILIEISTDAIRFSQDGGSTWTTELKIDGETITNILSAVGVNAEWINAGTLSSMVLQGTRGEIGNWTIQDYALMAEFVSAVQNAGYKVVLRAPAQALYEEDGVSTNNGTVEVDEETGQIRVTPETSGACAITIKTNRIIGYDDYRLTWTTNYSTGNMSVGLAVRYCWDNGSAYRVNWSASNRSASGTYRFYLSESTKQRVEGSSYGYGTLTFSLPSAVAGTEYQLDVSMLIDGEDVQTWIDDELPAGFSHDVVLGIYDEENREVATAIYGDGRIAFRKLETLHDDGEPYMSVDENTMWIVNDFALWFRTNVEGSNYHVAKIYTEFDVSGDDPQIALVISPGSDWISSGGTLLKTGLKITGRTYLENGYVNQGLLAGFVKLVQNSNGKRIETTGNSNGTKMALTDENEIHFFSGSSPSANDPTFKIGETQPDGLSGFGFNRRLYSSVAVKAPEVREFESTEVRYVPNSSYASLNIYGDPMKSGNMVWWSFDVSGIANAFYDEIKIAEVRECKPIADVQVPIVTNESEAGDFAYCRIDTSGNVYLRCYDTTGRHYAPSSASVCLTWLYA